MDELIIQVLQRDAPPDVVERVRAWRAESDANESYFRETERLWALTEPTPARSVPSPDAAVIVAAAEARRAERRRSVVIPLETRRAGPRMGRSVVRWGVALAAAAAAVALGLRLELFTPASRSTPYAAEAGAPRVVALADGSFVKLAPGSRLETRFAASARVATLEGRAFFAVARDEDRPFVVRVGTAETRVLGTRFEVAEDGGAVRTVVVEGLVALSNESGSVDVPAGSVGRASDGAAPALEAASDVYALLDWPEGVMLFQATPLAQVAREVERRFGRRVEVVGDLRTVGVSGTLEDESFEEVVLSLCQITGADCTLTADGARIRR